MFAIASRFKATQGGTPREQSGAVAQKLDVVAAVVASVAVALVAVASVAVASVAVASVAVVLIALGLVVAAAAAVVMTVAVRATRRAIWSGPGPAWLPGVAPGDVVELSTAMARTAHLYRGFGHERAVHRAVRALDRSSRHRPRVWSIATLDCETLGRSTWFRLDDGTAVRIDQPVATISGEPASETSIPEALISSAELVAAHRRPTEVVLQFRDADTRIELRGSGAAIL